MKFPKEAWYEGNMARQVRDDVYFVSRGSWSDPVYVQATKITHVPVFGAYIEGKEANGWDVLDIACGDEPDDYEPTPKELQYATYDSIAATEGKL